MYLWESFETSVNPVNLAKILSEELPFPHDKVNVKAVLCSTEPFKEHGNVSKVM